ncbi:hypothetical protein GvMRE_IIg54 [endosymbiont GvMRE of Glomus versiforme]|nr:hypothetical protein GvMRE_IIg54 [endosymbiont GvMRE of Glomus versiforme]
MVICLLNAMIRDLDSFCENLEKLKGVLNGIEAETFKINNLTPETGYLASDNFFKLSIETRNLARDLGCSCN